MEHHGWASLGPRAMAISTHMSRQVSLGERAEPGGTAGTADTSQGCHSNKTPSGSCIDGTTARALPARCRQ